jgi:hypothetical protein
MTDTIHLIGNGDQAVMYKPAKGLKIICNMPPFEVANVYATCMVDFKMMKALHEGSLQLDMYHWILGTRPRKWMEMQPGFYMKYAHCVKDFYPIVPKYAVNATNFNCGHMAAHYCANVLKGKEIHMYGFDSLFDFNMRSITDLYLSSDRSHGNNYRLLNNWRPIWPKLFAEFPESQFILHHPHNDLKFKLESENVEVTTA